MESWIRSTVKAAKTDDKQKHLRLPEAAFLNGNALPVLSGLLKTHAGLSEEQAQRALLNEYYRTTPDISRQSPIRWERHPFRKVLGASASDIYRGWTNPEKGGALTQSCPDFSLRDPFPHSILFEGKYSPRGSLEFATTAGHGYLSSLLLPWPASSRRDQEAPGMELRLRLSHGL